MLLQKKKKCVKKMQEIMMAYNLSVILEVMI